MPRKLAVDNVALHEAAVGRTVIAFAEIERMLDCIVGLAIYHGRFGKPSNGYPTLLEPKIRFIEAAFEGSDLLAPFAARGSDILRRARCAARDRNWLVHAIATIRRDGGLDLEMLRYAGTHHKRLPRALSKQDLVDIPERSQRLVNELQDLVSTIINAAAKSNDAGPFSPSTPEE